MPSFYAVPYTIHFDDTMAYGSHHFLTGFKFQCAAREAFLFGAEIFDSAGVREALDRIHLLTLDAYSRNLNSAMLGDRIALLLSLEEWGQASARFCYRAVDSQGRRICAGFQMLVCANATSGDPMILPDALRCAMDQMRAIEEPYREISFRERAIAGGKLLDEVFDEDVCQLAVEYLRDRYPAPRIIEAPKMDAPETEAWIFVGQGGFEADLLHERMALSQQKGILSQELLQECVSIAKTLWGVDASPLFLGDVASMRSSTQEFPELAQLGIHLQNVLGGYLRLLEFKLSPEQILEPAIIPKSHRIPVRLIGHSFGELAAFTLAGCLNLTDSIRAVCSRSTAVSAFAPPDSGLLAVLASHDKLEADLKRQPNSRCVIAGRNHQDQCVLSGPIAELQTHQQSLNQDGIRSVFIASPTSFHHPALEPVAKAWLEALRPLNWQEPCLSLYTPIGRRSIGRHEDHAAILASQLLAPFDFAGALQDTAAEGVKTFVDLGSTGLIAKLIDRSSTGDWKVIRSEIQPARREFAPTDLPTDSQAAIPAPPSEQPAPHSEQETAPLSALSDISIVGMGCILPAGATSPERLLQAIETQELGLVDLRDHDPNWERDFYSPTLTPDRSTSCLFGRVRDSDIAPPSGLDPAWFSGLSRTQRLLAIGLFPCLTGLRGAQRVVCLVGATADGFEDQDEVASWLYAGITPQAPSLGAPENWQIKSPHQAVQEVVDYLIGAGTQVMLVDAACASSLYSVSLGMNLLESNLADAVIAGGVFCPGPGNSCLFSQFKGTTSTGCRPFDKNSDGVVFSEGAAFVTLRKQTDAHKLQLPVAATIKAVGLSSDGRSGSANVPQSKGQILSLKRAYASYSLDPRSIVAIEGHGTSTPVGDSTEIETLNQFFEPLNISPIPVHSLKGTLGHAGWAAGSASIIAAAMYMATRRFPGQAFLKTPSEAVNKSTKTLQVNPMPSELNANPLRLAINGFGFGGANAHLVLESNSASQSNSAPQSAPRSSHAPESCESVVVALHQIEPSDHAAPGGRFDRQKVDLSREFVVLPELLDDMDISQKLAALLGKKVLGKLPNITGEARAMTSIVLAMSDKTERGVEATFRVLYPRMMRTCSDPQLIEQLKATHATARPSGAYTLQCMMPNVASGRAALLLNTNGPNFVVDSGKQSFRSAFDCAKLLLQGGAEGGTQLVLVEAIQANSHSLAARQFPNQEPECAAVFAVTTRAYANEMNWPIVSTTDRIDQALQKRNGHPLADQIRSVVELCHSQTTHSTATHSQTIEQPTPVELAPVEPLPVAAASAVATPVVATPAEVAPAEVAAVGLEPARSSPPRQASQVPAHPIYTPLWVAKNLQPTPRIPEVRGTRFASTHETLFLVSAKPSLVQELIQELQRDLAPGVPPLIVLVGDEAPSLAAKYPDHQFLVLSPSADPTTTSTALNTILEETSKQPLRHLVVLDRPDTWELDAIIPQNVPNELCEALFLLLQQFHTPLASQQLTVWHLALDSWNQCLHPSTGAISGMLKAVRREYPNLHCGSLYTEGMLLDQALDKLVDERAALPEESEICYRHHHRFVRRLTNTVGKNRQGVRLNLNSGSVVLATGGAKGVTAVMLQAIAERSQSIIVAFGRSPLEKGPEDERQAESAFYRSLLAEVPKVSPIEMKRRFEAKRASWEAFEAVDDLRKRGATVEYLVVDVNDAHQVDAAIEQVAAKFGRIDLVIHGAGVQYSKKLTNRTLDEFRKTYRTKVGGLEHLFQSVQRHVRNTVAFHPLTSAFSIFGNDGQHDYGAANETLDRTSEFARIHAGKNWFTIAWLAWDGVGMTRGSEYQALAKQRGLSGMDAATGQAIFLATLDGETDAAINVPMSVSEHSEYDIQTVPTINAPNGAGFGTARYEAGQENALGRISGEQVFEFDLTEEDFPCLPDHLVRGIPTVPGAWMLEAFVKCALRLYPTTENIRSVTLSETRFVRFVKPSHDRAPNVRVILETNDDGFDASIVLNIRHSSGRLLQKDVVCARSKLRFSTASVHEEAAMNKPSHLLPVESLVELPVRQDPYCSPGAPVELSGEFDCIRNIRIGKELRSASIHPTLFERWPSVVPATELDAAWRVGAMHASRDGTQLFAPISIEKIWLPILSEQLGPAGHGWSIRSTAPEVEAGQAFWRQTDVSDSAGRLQIRVYGAQAQSLQS